GHRAEPIERRAAGRRRTVVDDDDRSIAVTVEVRHHVDQRGSGFERRNDDRGFHFFCFCWTAYARLFFASGKSGFNRTAVSAAAMPPSQSPRALSHAATLLYASAKSGRSFAAAVALSTQSRNRPV